ncbi:MAG: hypothetical protein J5564_02800 [Clostridia bacterium]|nr:hypothetical protein [Clostridia bacterium]
MCSRTRKAVSFKKAFMFLKVDLKNNGKTIPVQFELKQDNNEKNNAVYAAAAIKEGAITVQGKDDSSPWAAAPSE